MHITKFNNVSPNTISLKMLLLAIVGICVLALTSCPSDPDDDTNGDGEPKPEGIIITPVAGMATFADDTLTILPAATLAKAPATTLEPAGNASMVKVVDVSVNYSGADNIKGILFFTVLNNPFHNVQHIYKASLDGGASIFYPDGGDFSMSSQIAEDSNNGTVFQCIGKMAGAKVECYLVTANALNVGPLAISVTRREFGFIGGLPADFDRAFNVATSNGTDSITGGEDSEVTTMIAADGISTAKLPFNIGGTVTIVD